MPGEGYALSSPGNEGSGPQDGSEPRFLIVGKIAGSSGLHGAVKVDVMTDFPERFGALDTVYLGDEMAPHRIRDAEVRKGGRQVILRFHGCDTRNQADDLRGRLIWIPIDEAMPLEEGRYYVHQVLGLKVQTEAGEPLGTLSEILVTGGNDVYVVNDGEREVLIPVLHDVIREVDLPGRRMIVRLPEGLLG